MQKLPTILTQVEKAGHKVFSNGDYDLNIIGVRNPKGKPDQFDDIMYVVFKVNGLWQVESFQITTDPGLYFMKKPANVDGTAILKAGQYRGAYKIDKHRGKYNALCQRAGSVVVWRDNNKDDVVDYDHTQKGYFGINIHRAHQEYELDSVGKYSAGCQVFRRAEDLERLLWLCGMQIKTHNWDTFTYTLLDSKDKPAKKK
tara:strand:- start:5752 stop:6351 length:600 start_codon:yes stop_codon:yes gene_type:complete